MFWRTWWRSQLNLGWQPTRSTRQRYRGRCINTWSYFHVDYGQESTKTFSQSLLIALDQLATEGKVCNWYIMLAHQLKEQVTRARQPPKGMQADIYMSSYMLDVICTQKEFPGLKWAWTTMETIVNTYCKMLSKCSFRGVVTSFQSFFQLSIQDDIQIVSNLHVKGRNGGTDRHSRLVCLTVQYFHMDVQRTKASAFFTKVSLGHTHHIGSSISHLDRLNS